jgi:predicted outer membrane repeat protein
MIVGLMLVCGGQSVQADPGDVFYVNRNNISGVEDGLTWATAFTTIQAGVDFARNQFGGDVWVAQGVYNETRANSGALVLRPGVNLYGGFEGREVIRGQRDPLGNPTIIDGSVSANGSPAVTVVIGAANTVIDGFTIRGGRGQDGGGMTNIGVSPTVVNCVFRDNRSERFGGAMLNVDQASPRIVDCVFTNNQAEESGGAVANTDAQPEFIDCLFSLNTAGIAGGAIFNTPGSDIVVRGTMFEFNVAETGGGAVFNEGAKPYFEACTFLSNEAGGFGGALFNNLNEDDVIAADTLAVNCVFAKNYAEEGGAAITTLASIMTAVNCTFADNESPNGGSAFFNNGADTDVLNSVLWYNTEPVFTNVLGSNTLVRWSNVGGGDSGPNNIALEPMFTDRMNNDYSILPESPNIDAGTANGAPNVDIRGIARPQGDGIDIGAYEEFGPGSEPGMPGCFETDGESQNADGGTLLIMLAMAGVLVGRRR